MLDKSEMIFGVRAVIEALQAGKEIDKILVKKIFKVIFPRSFLQL
jgi:23S rRNA (guanosine2251-2'-O)-methyltransferase